MKNVVSTGFAVALVAAWGVAAQGQQPGAPGRPGPGASAGGDQITVAGCVERDGASFKLTDAKAAPAAAGVPAPASSSKVEDEYTLVASAGVNLAPHVNHQVEVTGTASEAVPTPAPPAVPPSSSGVGDGPAAQARSAVDAAMRDTPAFAVSALKMVSASCN